MFFKIYFIFQSCDHSSYVLPVCHRCHPLTYLLKFTFLVISTPNLGLKLMTLRSRVTCFTDWASQMSPYLVKHIKFNLLDYQHYKIINSLKTEICCFRYFKIYVPWTGQRPIYIKCLINNWTFVFVKQRQRWDQVCEGWYVCRQNGKK